MTLSVTPETAETARLASVLFGAGVLLLALEIFFVTRVFALVGALTLLGAAALAFWKVSIEMGSLLFLGGATLVSLGFLVMLAFFPNAPLARQFLARGRDVGD